MMLQFQQVTKKYGRTVALREFSATIATGTVAVLRGANGSGKSTVLRLAAGIAVADQGDISIGTDKIGYLSHRGQLIPDVSLRDTLAIQLALFGVTLQSNGDLAQSFGIDQFWDKPPAALSRGMRQRAGLFRALAPEAELLLLDEPTNGLDSAARQVLATQLQQALGRGATIVIATHDDIDGVVPSQKIELQ